MISDVCLYDLLRFLLTKLDGWKALLPEDLYQFYDFIMNEASNVEDTLLKDEGVIHVSLISHVLVQQIIKNKRRVVCVQ